MRIDSSIPTPDAREIACGWPVYPFGQMNVGDSFTVDEARASATIAAAKKWRQRHPGWQHTWQRSGGELRVWRTA